VAAPPTSNANEISSLDVRQWFQQLQRLLGDSPRQGLSISVGPPHSDPETIAAQTFIDVLLAYHLEGSLPEPSTFIDFFCYEDLAIGEKRVYLYVFSFYILNKPDIESLVEHRLVMVPFGQCMSAHYCSSPKTPRSGSHREMAHLHGMYEPFLRILCGLQRHGQQELFLLSASHGLLVHSILFPSGYLRFVLPRRSKISSVSTILVRLTRS